MNRVLVYGTLRKGQGNHRVMEYAGGKFIRSLNICGFRMHTLWGGYPGVVRTDDAGDWLTCELYEVESMDNLDYLEGYNPRSPGRGLYNRQQIDIDGEPTWIYTYNHDVTGEVINDWNTWKENQHE